jgi:hypothetical protein
MTFVIGKTGFLSSIHSRRTAAFIAPVRGNEGARGDVDLDPEVSALFREFYASATGPFVIESPIKPRMGTTYRHYRCNKIFEPLFAWIRSKGISSANLLHTLCKEFGSRINDAYGIYAASRALRHADIKITSHHYVDNKSRATVVMGHLLTRDGEAVDKIMNRVVAEF